MKEYSLSIPVSGYITTLVEAESEEEAITKASADTEISLDDVEEWEMHRKIVEGNFFHGLRNEISVDCVGDVDEDEDEEVED